MKNSKRLIALFDILYRNPDTENPAGSIWAPYFWKEGCFRREGNLFLLSKEHLEMFFHRTFPLSEPYWEDRLWSLFRDSSDVLPEYLQREGIYEEFEFVTYKEAHDRKEPYIVPVKVEDPGRFIEWNSYGAEFPQEIIEDCKEGKATIVFECPWEGNHTSVEDIDNFDLWLQKQQLTSLKDRIWYTNNVLGGPIRDYLESPERHFQYKPVPFFEGLPWGGMPGGWGRDCRKATTNYTPMYNLEKLESYLDKVTYSFDKKFLALFGALREHRIFLYGFINIHPELKEETITSLRNNYDCWEMLSNPNSNERKFSRGLDEGVDHFLEEYSKQVGDCGEDYREIAIGDTGDVYSVYGQPLRDRCFLELVTETGYMNNNCLSYTEKTFKSILSKKPFILLGGYCGMLKKLRDMGYQTFGDFWDESYDDIQDPRERLKAVGKLLLDLNQYSIEDLREMKRQMKSILDHNFKVIAYSQRFNEVIDWYKNLVRQGKQCVKFV